MKAIFNTYRPEGFHTVNSYLFAEDPEGLIEFLQQAFYATILNITHKTDGSIANCILQIGDSCLMVSQATGQFINMRTAFYLFVEDVDLIFNRALEFGATVCYDPADTEYQDRQGGVIDKEGNYWWISKRLVQTGY